MGGERGQGSVEYAGLIMLIAVAGLGLAAVVGPRSPARDLAAAIADGLVCAVADAERCAAPVGTAAAYGPHLAAVLRARAPDILFEDGEAVSVPIDFRACMERSCADAAEAGSLAGSDGGERPTAFVHVIDCRAEGSDAGSAGCGGEARGNLYLQYWLYYPDSYTRPFAGSAHPDDWESYQVRISPGGDIRARASSHHGHNSDGSAPSRWRNDAGVVPSSGWGEVTGSVWVSGGSHAGRTEPPGRSLRRIESSRLRLVPLAQLSESERSVPFAVTPPWRKRLWTHPEERGTG